MTYIASNEDVDKLIADWNTFAAHPMTRSEAWTLLSRYEPRTNEQRCDGSNRIKNVGMFSNGDCACPGCSRCQSKSTPKGGESVTMPGPRGTEFGNTTRPFDGSPTREGGSEADAVPATPSAAPVTTGTGYSFTPEWDRGYAFAKAKYANHQSQTIELGPRTLRALMAAVLGATSYRETNPSHALEWIVSATDALLTELNKGNK